MRQALREIRLMHCGGRSGSNIQRRAGMGDLRFLLAESPWASQTSRRLLNQNDGAFGQLERNAFVVVISMLTRSTTCRPGRSPSAEGLIR